MTKQNQAITVNRLPAKTWNWLKMNETVIGMPRIDGSIAIKQSVAEAGQAEDEQLRMAQQTDWDKITTGMGEAMDQPSETDVAWDTELCRFRNMQTAANRMCTVFPTKAGSTPITACISMPERTAGQK